MRLETTGLPHTDFAYRHEVSGAGADLARRNLALVDSAAKRVAAQTPQTPLPFDSATALAVARLEVAVRADAVRFRIHAIADATLAFGLRGGLVDLIAAGRR